MIWDLIGMQLDKDYTYGVQAEDMKMRRFMEEF